VSEIVGFVGLSHSPFLNFLPPEPGGPGSQFLDATTRLRQAVEVARPDVLVVIGPDHFHANFYDVMPPFLIGAGQVEGFGDYGSRAGPLEVATEIAWSIFEDITAAGFDPALSLDLMADHGIVQAVELMAPAGSSIPIVPVIVNAAGPPLPTLSRCMAFGEALGKALRSAPGAQRILVISSGGLSHWIPSTDPRDPEMDAGRREGLIRGRLDRRAFAAAREPKVRALGGTATARVDEKFDRWFLDQIRHGDLHPIAALSATEILANAGNGGQEIRSWLAGICSTEDPITWTSYESVPQWLTGMATATSLPAPPAQRLT
jgi:2,3-dihydroxyphenylpropionate 1,2-dioxygenase